MSAASILVLGGPSAGKTTVCNKLSYLSSKGITKDDSEERSSQLPSIFRLVLVSMQTLCQQSDRFSPIPADSPAHLSKLLLERVTGNESIQAELVQAVRLLWADPHIRQTYAQRAHFHLSSMVSYFFDRIDDVCQPSYVPTGMDALWARTPNSGGVVESDWTLGNATVRLIDVGKHRRERSDKWLHHFDQVSSVIFVVDLSSYDQPHPTDGRSCLQHAIDDFAAKCNSRAFRSTPFIVLLNKRDVFEKKLQTTPLSCCFPSYQGDGSYGSASAYVLDQLRASSQNVEREIFALVATAITDDWCWDLTAIINANIRRTKQAAGLTTAEAAQSSAAATRLIRLPASTHLSRASSASRSSKWRRLWGYWSGGWRFQAGTASSRKAPASSSATAAPAASSDVALPTEQAESVLLSQLREWQEVQSLTSHLPFLERARACEADLAALVSAQQSRSSWSRARAAILSDPLLSSYSTYFQLTLIDVMTACKAIHSGWVSCGYTDMKDWLIAAFEITLDLVPVSIPGSGFLTAALQFANDRPKAHAVNAMAVWCISHDDWAVFVQQLAVLVCGVKREAIAKEGKGDKEKGVMGRMMEGGKAAMRALMVDDKHSALRRMADTDARRVCWAIMQEAVRPLHSLDERDVHAALQQAVWAVMEGRYSKQEWVEGSPVGESMAVAEAGGDELSVLSPLSSSQLLSRSAGTAAATEQQLQFHPSAALEVGTARKPVLQIQVQEDVLLAELSTQQLSGSRASSETRTALSTFSLTSPPSAAAFADWTALISAEMAERQQREAELTAKLEEQARQLAAYRQRSEEDRRRLEEEQRRLELQVQRVTVRPSDVSVDAGTLAFAHAQCSPRSAQQMQASERRLKREVAQLGQQVSLLTEELQQVKEEARRPRPGFFSPTSTEDSEEEEEREREQEEQRAARMAQLTQTRKKARRDGGPHSKSAPHVLNG